MSLRCLLLLAVAATSLSAQVIVTVSPVDVPIGCPVGVVVSNDTPNLIYSSSCLFTVEDLSGTPIFTPGCGGIANPVPSGGVFESYWTQIDNSLTQVPAGTYRIVARGPMGITSNQLVNVGAGTTAHRVVGTPRIGSLRTIEVCAPAQANQPYVLAASATRSAGFFACGNFVPIDPDPLFLYSLQQPNPIFQNFGGNFDAMGMSRSSSLAIPNDPTLIGAQLHLAFVVLGGPSVCPIVDASRAITVTIL